MTDEQEPLHERVLEFAPLSIKLALNDLGTWLQGVHFPFTSVTLVLILHAGRVEIRLTGRTSRVEEIYGDLLKHLKMVP
jgi:hypothetical protein